MNTIKVLLVVVSAIALASCNDKKASGESVATVRLDTVQLASAGAVLQFPGRVVASDDASLSFKVSGTIARICKDQGDRVQAGQLVAELDATDYKVQLAATEAEYARVKADADRITTLYNEGAATASNYDKARFGLQQVEAKLKNHRDQVAYCKLYAPFSGTVQTRYFHGGENVAAGMPVLSLVSSANPEIEINLPASSFLRRASFVRYSAQFDVLPGAVIPLRFISVMSKANANQLYTMRLKIEGDTKGIAPGMSSWVSILASDSVFHVEVRVPTTSLVEDKGESFVYLYDGQSQTVRRCHVKVVRLHTDGTAVVEGALVPGNIVVSTGANHIKTGDRVTPLPPVSETNVGGLL